MARPKSVMITHRNAAINSIGTLLHLPIAVGERYLGMAVIGDSVEVPNGCAEGRARA